MSWRKKIINDYIYKLDTGAYTGAKGALEYGKNLEEDGFTNEQIEKCISRSKTKTVNIRTEYILLNKINGKSDN